MKIQQILEAKKGVKAPKNTVKPRNFVAKNAIATTSGAGAHKDKKKAAKQGDVKHKNKELAESFNPEYDDEAGMADNNLATLERAVQGIDDIIGEGDNLPEWCQEKIAVAKSMLVAVWDYMKSEEQSISEGAVKELMMDLKSLPENEFINKYKKTKAEARAEMKSVDEGHYRRPGSSSAYDRDYASSVSGMGKRDSLAYQLDGGANDEGWDEPRGQYQAQQDKPVLQGYYFYDVPAGKEQEAASYGIKQTKSGKWAKAKYSTSGRSFGMQKDMADKAFGPGKYWAPK